MDSSGALDRPFSETVDSSEPRLFFWRPVVALARREVVRFFRQRSRVVGALGSPLIFWFLIGSGLGSSFQSSAAPLVTGYLEFFFPGTIILVVLFAGIFSNISLIED